MSFILDALKKSETDRQQQSSAEFAKVPTSTGPVRAPGWLLLLGLLLAINLLVLLGLFFRSTDENAATPAAPLAQTNTLPSENTEKLAAQENPGSQEQPSFANRIAEAQRNRPQVNEDAAVVKLEDGLESAPLTAVAIEEPSTNAALLPTIYEVVANGSVVLPELHLDIHVYSKLPKDRFVFINMSKQREKSQLSEGPIVEEIRPDGVVLAYRGTSFLLPRD